MTREEAVAFLKLNGCRIRETVGGFQRCVWDRLTRKKEVFEALRLFPNIRGLSCSGAPFDDSDLEEIGKLKSIEFLSFRGCRGIKGSGLKHLNRLAKLRDLRIDGTLIDDEGLKNLPPLPTSIRCGFPIA